MSSTSQPFGLRPAYSQSGTIRPTAYTIASGYATGILQNQPVKLGTNGTIEAAAVGDRFIGTFQGVEYTATATGRRTYSNQWTASTTGSDIVCYVTEDPTLVYEIQSNATIAVADIGSQADFTAASGSTVTGLDTQMLDTATLTTSGNASLKIIGISAGPDNAAGDSFVIVQVQIAEHQFVADRVAF